MKTLTEQQRVTIFAALLIVSVFLTYYFHAVLTLGTVFSHFFYIPIILAALWWEKKSILVAIFLGALVVVSSLFYRPDILTLNDYGRALMFVVIALVVASLSEQSQGAGAGGGEGAGPCPPLSRRGRQPLRRHRCRPHHPAHQPSRLRAARLL
ncbi:MAG: hypothetical protein RQM90_09960 [Methanoculleus sp.]